MGSSKIRSTKKIASKEIRPTKVRPTNARTNKRLQATASPPQAFAQTKLAQTKLDRQIPTYLVYAIISIILIGLGTLPSHEPRRPTPLFGSYSPPRNGL